MKLHSAGTFLALVTLAGCEVDSSAIKTVNADGSTDEIRYSLGSFYENADTHQRDGTYNVVLAVPRRIQYPGQPAPEDFPSTFAGICMRTDKTKCFADRDLQVQDAANAASPAGVTASAAGAGVPGSGVPAQSTSSTKVYFGAERLYETPDMRFYIWRGSLTVLDTQRVTLVAGYTDANGRAAKVLYRYIETCKDPPNLSVCAAYTPGVPGGSVGAGAGVVNVGGVVGGGVANGATGGVGAGAVDTRSVEQIADGYCNQSGCHGAPTGTLTARKGFADLPGNTGMVYKGSATQAERDKMKAAAGIP
jgi:hypothetical protein